MFICIKNNVKEKRKKKRIMQKNVFTKYLCVFLNTCSHFSLPLPSQNRMTVCSRFGNKMEKGKKPFNLYSASVYNAGYLTTAALWALVVDDTKQWTETGILLLQFSFAYHLFVYQFVPIG